MKLRLTSLLCLALCACASNRPPQQVSTNVAVEPDATDLVPSRPIEPTNTVRLPEQLKAYPVGRYADPADPDVLHEAHTVYRAEASPRWNIRPQVPSYVPLGPSVGAFADPAAERAVLNADLEQKIERQNLLLQATADQNERLAQELQELKAELRGVPHPSSPSFSSETASTNGIRSIER